MTREPCPVCSALPGTPCRTPQGYRMPRRHDAATILDFLDDEGEPRIDTDWLADRDQ